MSWSGRQPELVRIVQVMAIFLLCILYSDILFLAAVSLVCVFDIARRGRLRAVTPLVKLSLFVIAFIFLFNLIIPSGSTKVVGLWFWTLNREPLLFSLSMSLRLFGTVFAFGMLVVTTEFDALLRLVSRVGPRIGAVLGISARYYDGLREEARSIEEAMSARGLEMRKGSWLRRIRARIPTVLPLVYCSLERAIRTAESMECRGFGLSKRSRERSMEFGVRDVLLLSLVISSVAFAVIAFMGHSAGYKDYYGSVSWLDYSSVQILSLLIVSALLWASIGGWSNDRD